MVTYFQNFIIMLQHATLLDFQHSYPYTKKQHVGGQCQNKEEFLLVLAKI